MATERRGRMTRPTEMKKPPEENVVGPSLAVRPWQINRLAKRPTLCLSDRGVLEHGAGNKSRGFVGAPLHHGVSRR
ncbi:hypothetical protein VZT92_018028 [Zoarces viviparus]|uniref:Uncharacterized protein n=1 Tax=Zoarces viviparus TaxID=48416 RepID=A0AAW1EPR7_ZOAVI